MSLTANEIIPDITLTLYADMGLNLLGARHMLDKFLRVFGRTGEADQFCLFDILQMDIDEAREFLKEDSRAYDDDPTSTDENGQILAALQMMIHGYLSEQMVSAA